MSTVFNPLQPERTVLFVALEPDTECVDQLVAAGWHVVHAKTPQQVQRAVERGAIHVGLVQLPAACTAQELAELAACISPSNLAWIAEARRGQADDPAVRRFILDFCFDFVTVPCDDDRLTILMGHADGLWALRDSDSHQKAPAPTSTMIGQCEAMQQLNRGVDKCARNEAPVFIAGESGTGKELTARAIHDHSARAKAPFVAINCAAIPPSLLQSELFGHERGAFTGALQRKIGRIEAAAGGTLFLDEIGDMPYPLQVRLLRVLQERVVNPLGSPKTIPVDIAIVCATHRDLREMIAQNRFREDLYYRLNGLVVRLPPLRERKDLAVVIGKMLEREALRGGDGQPLTVAPEIMTLFERCTWPGNFRQLGNLLRTAAAMIDEDGEIRREHLPDDFFDDLQTSDASPAAAASVDTPAQNTPTEQQGTRLQDVAAQAIAATLAQHGGNVSAAARALGVSRATLYRKMPAAMPGKRNDRD